MSTEIETELKALQARITQAQNSQTRAEIERDNAKRRITEAKQTLKEKFGVSTVEEAKKLLSTKEAELAAELAKAEEQLTEAGA